MYNYYKVYIQMATLPEDLMFLLSKMEGVNRNCVQLNSHNAGSVQAGKILSITLPRNSVIDLRTLRFYFDITLSNTTASVFTRLPGDLHSLIRRLTLKVGGRTVFTVDEYATIYNMLQIVRGGTINQGKNAMNHPFVCTTTSAHGTSIASQELESYSTAPSFCLDNFLSLTEMQPPIIDTGLLPDLILEFEFMPADVLISSRDNTLDTTPTSGSTPSFTIENHYFTVDTLTWSDYDSYRKMIDARINNNNSIDLPFKRYEIYRGSHLGTSVFSVASSCINNVYATFRNSSQYNSTQEVESYDVFNPINNEFNGTMLKSKYFKFQDYDLHTYRWRVNNQAYPLFDGKPLHAYAELQNHMENKSNDTFNSHQLNNFKAFKDANFVIPLKLNHDNNLSLLSGADSRGTNSIIELVTTHGAALTTAEVFMLVECTSVFKIGRGGQLTVDE